MKNKRLEFHLRFWAIMILIIAASLWGGVVSGMYKSTGNDWWMVGLLAFIPPLFILPKL